MPSDTAAGGKAYHVTHKAVTHMKACQKGGIGANQGFEVPTHALSRVLLCWVAGLRTPDWQPIITDLPLSAVCHKPGYKVGEDPTSAVHRGLAIPGYRAHQVVEAMTGQDQDVLHHLPLEAVHDIVQVLPHSIR